MFMFIKNLSVFKVVFDIFSQLDMALSSHQLDSNQDIGSFFLNILLIFLFLAQVDRVKRNLSKSRLSLK